MTLRSRLFLLVAATLAPIAIAAIAVAALLLAHEREMLERDAIGRARGAMSAVDAHLRGSIVALETLAAADSLAAGDLRKFHADSQFALRTQTAWSNIAVTGADGTQLANAVYNFGKPEPASGTDRGSFDEAVRGARPSIGSVAAGTVVQRPTVRVRVPVAVEGKVRYVLTAPLNLAPLTALLEAQQLPEEWMVALIDRDKRVIVRIPNVPAGVPASDSFREAVGQEREGWFLGRTLEGRSVYTAYVTSDLSGWGLGIGIPEASVGAERRVVFTLLAAGILGALALGFALAWLIARRAGVAAR